MVLFERPFPLCSCWNLFQGFAGAISFGDWDGALTPAELEAVEVFREVDAAACSELLAAAHAPDTPPRLGKGEVEEFSSRSCEPDVIARCEKLGIMAGYIKVHECCYRAKKQRSMTGWLPEGCWPPKINDRLNAEIHFLLGLCPLNGHTSHLGGRNKDAWLISSKILKQWGCSLTQSLGDAFEGWMCITRVDSKLGCFTMATNPVR